MTWNNGSRTIMIDGRHVALALRMALRRIGNGYGIWEYFTDVDVAANTIQGVEQLLAALGVSGDQLGVKCEALRELERILEDARLRCEMTDDLKTAQEYTVRFKEDTPMQPAKAA